MVYLYLSRAFFVMLLVLVTFLTLTPNPQDSGAGIGFTQWVSAQLFSDPQYSDKIGHFLAYGVLSGAAIVAQIKLFGRFFPVTILLSFYGVLLEVIQGLGGVRSAEVMDALANSLGAAVAYPAGIFLLFVTGLIFRAHRAAKASAI